MRRFTFELEAVRRLRLQEEQLVQSELAAAFAKRDEIAVRLAASRSAEQDLYEYMRTERLSAVELEHVSRYGMLHRQRIVDAQIELGNHESSVSRIRIRLTEAQQRREALDRLEQRRRDEHQREWRAEESRELDEIGSRRRSWGAAA